MEKNHPFEDVSAIKIMIFHDHLSFQAGNKPFTDATSLPEQAFASIPARFHGWNNRSVGTAHPLVPAGAKPTLLENQECQKFIRSFFPIKIGFG